MIRYENYSLTDDAWRNITGVRCTVRLDSRADNIIFLDINVNGTASVANNWTATAGCHTLWVQVDYTRSIPELDETNNDLTYNFTVTNRPRPQAEFPIRTYQLSAVLIVAGAILVYCLSRRQKRVADLRLATAVLEEEERKRARDLKKEKARELEKEKADKMKKEVAGEPKRDTIGKKKTGPGA